MRAGLLFGDVSAGDQLTPLERGPLTPVHLMRWSAAIENWHRIHYDLPFATDHDGLPGLLVNGSWKQHFLAQMVREWAGPTGWLVRLRVQFRQMNLAGERLTAWGTVIETREVDGIGLIICEIGIRDDNEKESTPGTAIAALPSDESRPLPYPFPELSLE